MIATIERRAVLHAVAEAARVGPDEFLRRYGFAPGTRDTVEVGGLELPPKAVLGVAARYQHGGDPLRASEFSGGLRGAARQLVNLGFRVRRGGELLTPDDVSIPRSIGLRPVRADLRLYVCRPTSELAVEACRRHGFGTLLSPVERRDTAQGVKLRDLSGHVYPLDGRPYVLDNGAWTCHKAGAEWRAGPMNKLVERLGAGAEWLVLPDIVGAGEASLDRSISWLEDRRSWLADHGVRSVALAVQDGMTVDRVRPLLEQHQIGVLFVGGSAGVNTPNWKWRTLHDWAELGLDLGIRVHVGRVNGLRRALLCRDLGVSSIDGSCVTQYSVNAPKLAKAHDDVDAPHDVEAARYNCKRRRFELALGRPF